MPHGDVILTLQLCHGLTCGQRAAVHFLSFPRAGMGMRDRNILQWVKTTDIPDLVCANKQIFS